MVPAYRPSVFASGSVGVWVWHDFSEPGKAQFLLHDQREEALLGRLRRSVQSVCEGLATSMLS